MIAKAVDDPTSWYGYFIKALTFNYFVTLDNTLFTCHFIVEWVQLNALQNTGYYIITVIRMSSMKNSIEPN